MKRAISILCLLCFLCSVPVSHGQQAQQKESQQKDSDKPFTLSINTQLVVETVLVKDKDGKNIEGLTDKDFTVTEDGVAQTISVFQFQRLEDTSAQTQPAANLVQPKIPTQITTPPPGDGRYQNRRLLVLFFDLMNV